MFSDGSNSNMASNDIQKAINDIAENHDVDRLSGDENLLADLENHSSDDGRSYIAGISDENSNNTVIYSFENAEAFGIAHKRTSRTRGDPMLCGDHDSMSPHMFQAHIGDEDLNVYKTADNTMDCQMSNFIDERGDKNDATFNNHDTIDSHMDPSSFLGGDNTHSYVMADDNVSDSCATPASFPSPMSTEMIINDYDARPDKLFYSHAMYDIPVAADFCGLSSTCDTQHLEDTINTFKEDINGGLPDTCDPTHFKDQYDYPLDYSIKASVNKDSHSTYQDAIDKIKRDSVMKLKAEKKVNFGKRGRPSSEVINKVFEQWFLPFVQLSRTENMIHQSNSSSKKAKATKRQKHKKTEGNKRSRHNRTNDIESSGRLLDTGGGTWKKTLSKLFKYRNLINSHKNTKSKVITTPEKMTGQAKASKKKPKPKRTQRNSKLGHKVNESIQRGSKPYREDSLTPKYKPGPKCKLKQRIVTESTNIGKRTTAPTNSNARLPPKCKTVSTQLDDYVIEYTTEECVQEFQNDLPDYTENSDAEYTIADPNLDIVKQEPPDDDYEKKEQWNQCALGSAIKDSDAVLKIEDIRTIDPSCFQVDDVSSQIVRKSTEHDNDFECHHSHSSRNTCESPSISPCDSGLECKKYVHKKFGHGKKSPDFVNSGTTLSIASSHATDDSNIDQESTVNSTKDTETDEIPKLSPKDMSPQSVCSNQGTESCYDSCTIKASRRKQAAKKTNRQCNNSESSLCFQITCGYRCSHYII